MHGAHMSATDGVARAAFELVDELRNQGMRCEQALLAVKATVLREATYPAVVNDEIVSLCIVHYYDKRGIGASTRGVIVVS